MALGGITGLGAGCCIQGTAYIEGLMRNNVRFDYAGIHPYDNDSPNTHKQYDDNYDDVVLVYNELQQYPAYRNVKLWLTETANYNSDRLGEKTQADYFEIIMQRADSGFEGRIPPGVIEMVHIFIDRDHPEFPGTGAFRSNSTPKQSPIVCGRTSLDGHLRPTRGSIGRSRAPLASATEF